MTALRLSALTLPLALALLAGCPAPEEVSPEPARPAAASPVAPAGATPVAVAQPQAAGCGCGSAAKAGGCGQKVGECGGACAGEGTGSCGCGSAAKAQQALGPIVPATNAKVGDLTKCPVSGGVFQVDANTPWVSHEGKTYPVCCPGCAARFKADPSKFLDV